MRKAHVCETVQPRRSTERRKVRRSQLGHNTCSCGYRFATADLAVLSSCQHWATLKLIVSAYDINCQYRINFYDRMQTLEARLSEFLSIRKYFCPEILWISGVGKFHIPAHKVACRYEYSFNYLPGVGMTDGEAVERIWSSLNSISLRTREMASGHRHDTINDFHDYKNVDRTNRLREFDVWLSVDMVADILQL